MWYRHFTSYLNELKCMKKYRAEKKIALTWPQVWCINWQIRDNCTFYMLSMLAGIFCCMSPDIVQCFLLVEDEHMHWRQYQLMWQWTCNCFYPSIIGDFFQWQTYKALNCEEKNSRFNYWNAIYVASVGGMCCNWITHHHCTVVKILPL